jgi:hypothetical protein
VRRARPNGSSRIRAVSTSAAETAGNIISSNSAGANKASNRDPITRSNRSATSVDASTDPIDASAASADSIASAGSTAVSADSTDIHDSSC